MWRQLLYFYVQNHAFLNMQSASVFHTIRNCVRLNKSKGKVFPSTGLGGP
jgi:hypothetical protein